MEPTAARHRSTHPLLAVLVVVVAILVPDVLVSVVVLLSTGAGAGGGLSLGGQLALLGVPFGLSLVLILVWVRGVEHRPFATLGFTTPVRAALPGAVAGALLFGIVVLVAAAFGQVRVGDANPAAVGGVLVALAGFAVQGSTEEILFRGFLLQAIRTRWGLPVAVGGQALVFAALHLGNTGALAPLVIPDLLLFACFLAGWTLREGGLWGACAWHATWNWVQGNVFGAAVSGIPLDTTIFHTTTTAGASDWLTGGPFGLESSVITTVVLAFGTAAVFAAGRNGTRTGAAR